MCAAARYYDISPKADRGDIFIVHNRMKQWIQSQNKYFYNSVVPKWVYEIPKNVCVNILRNKYLIYNKLAKSGRFQNGKRKTRIWNIGIQGNHTSADVKALTKLKTVQFKLAYYKSMHGNKMQTLIYFNIGLRRHLLLFVKWVKSASDEIKGIWLINHPDTSLITIKGHHDHLIQNKRQI